MSLRPYQIECLSAVRSYELQDCVRQLIVLPCGTGKTMIASNLPATIGMADWEVTIFLVAQEELAWQARDSLAASNPGCKVGVEKAQHFSADDDDIIVASVDTLARSPDRLARLAALPIRIVFVDEAHGAVSPKYIAVLKALRVLKDEADEDRTRLLVGLTATPRRFDGIALRSIFDKITFRRSIQEMVKDDWLADPIAYRVDTGANLDDIRMNKGDYATGELSRKMNTPEINALVVQKYFEYAAGLPAIAFTVDIQHSNDLADTFRHHDMEFHAISSNTPDKERKRLVAAHQNMEIMGLCSCQALLVGFDSPPATAALWARPTCSGLLYTQGSGRVMRPYPAPEARAQHGNGYVKQHAIIIDFVGVSEKHRLYTASTLFGLSPQFDMAGRRCIEVEEEVAALAQKNPTLDITAYHSLDELNAAAHSVDLWRPAPIPQLAKTCSQFIWMQSGDNTYRLNAPGMAVFIEVDHLGDHQVWRRAGDTIDSKDTFREPEDAFAYADSLVPDEVVNLIRAKARWRKDPPTLPQCEKLWRMDPLIHKRFSNGHAFLHWATYQVEHEGNFSFSKGNLSLRIDMLREGRAKTKETAHAV